MDAQREDYPIYTSTPMPLIHCDSSGDLNVSFRDDCDQPPDDDSPPMEIRKSEASMVSDFSRQFSRLEFNDLLEALAKEHEMVKFENMQLRSDVLLLNAKLAECLSGNEPKTSLRSKGSSSSDISFSFCPKVEVLKSQSGSSVSRRPSLENAVTYQQSPPLSAVPGNLRPQLPFPSIANNSDTRRNSPATSPTRSPRLDQRKRTRMSDIPVRPSFWSQKSKISNGSIAPTRKPSRIYQIKSLFPSWYDPEASHSGTREPIDQEIIEERQVMDMITQNFQAKEGSEVASRCILSPVGTKRLIWDAVAIFCLLYELWSTVFALIFLSDDAKSLTLDLLDWLVIAFFGVDIILNFCTGYLTRDRIVWKPRLIVKRYLQGWFVLDFVATMPWDAVFYALSAADVLSLVRFAKITKAFKTLKFLRLARASRGVRSMQETEKFNEFFAAIAFVTSPLKVLIVFSLASHLNGAAWSWLQLDWEPAIRMQDAWRTYYHSMWWAFMALTVGHTVGNDPRHDRPSLWTLDIVVSIQRLCIIGWLLAWGTFCFLSKYQDEAHLYRAKADATKYLRRREVSVRTQIQVLFSIWETGHARNMQRHFRELILDGLPVELQRKISYELWAAPLMSLGLLMHASHWHDDLIAELALVAQEEVLSSRSILFQERNAAILAYYIIHGHLTIFTSLSNKPVPPFTDGMWLGEKSLINPMLRRSGTAVCNTMSTFMSLSGESFHQVLSSLGIMHEFKQFCIEFLWRGLCGRCGVLGDHFTHECPLLDPSANTHVSDLGRLPSRRNSFQVGQSLSTFFTNLTAISRVSKHEVKLDKKLREFLSVQNLEWLGHAFKTLGITKMEHLQDLDLDVVQQELNVSSGGALVLTADAQHALSPQAVEQFSAALSRQTGDLFATTTARTQHFLFLSHYKVEAGTEAALIRNELEQIIQNDSSSPAHQFTAPIFLDSEDLTNLSLLQSRVRQSHNIALLLTKNVLSRPWVLIEIVTAFGAGVHVVPVLLLRGFDQFVFPNDEFYEALRDGSLLGESGCDLLKDCGIEIAEVEQAMRSTFKRIAVPYSPHRPESIRRSELQSLLKQCRLKRAFMPDICTTKSKTDSKVSFPASKLNVERRTPSKTQTMEM